jgi:hypothetical protein
MKAVSDEITHINISLDRDDINELITGKKVAQMIDDKNIYYLSITYKNVKKTSKIPENIILPRSHLR